MYDLNHFINKAESIPEHLWLVGDFEDGIRKCFYAHCGMKEKEVSVFNAPKEALALYYIVGENISFTDIHDGKNPMYPQKTAKQRTLAFFYYLKSKSAVTEAETIINQNKNEILWTT